MAELARPLRQADHRQLFGDDLVDLRLRRPTKLEPEGDVLLHRAPRQKRELLEHHGDAARAKHPEFVGAAMSDVDRALAVADENLAPGDFVEAVHGAKDRGLARSRQSHQHADFARLDRKVDARRAENDSGRFQDIVARRSLVDERQRLGLPVAEDDVDMIEDHRRHFHALPFRSGLRKTRSSTIASRTIETPASIPIGILTVPSARTTGTPSPAAPTSAAMTTIDRLSMMH